jgi:hypothetical protein
MKLWVLAAAAASIFGIAGNAFSGPVQTTPSFTVDITTSAGAAGLELTPTLTRNLDGTYSASGSRTVANNYSVLFNFTLNADPKIAGSFTLTSLSSSDQNFTVAATMGVTPFGPPNHISGSYGELKYSDTSTDGRLGVGANPFYDALIDGNSVATLGSFAFAPITSQPPGVFGTLSPETFDNPYPGVSQASSIGVSFEFMLTAGDQVQTPFEFTVVPEPTETALFSIFFALILCRIAREGLPAAERALVGFFLRVADASIAWPRTHQRG